MIASLGEGGSYLAVIAMTVISVFLSQAVGAVNNRVCNFGFENFVCILQASFVLDIK